MTNLSITRFASYLKDIQSDLEFLDTYSRELRRTVNRVQLRVDALSERLVSETQDIRGFSDVNKDRKS